MDVCWGWYLIDCKHKLVDNFEKRARAHWWFFREISPGKLRTKIPLCWHFPTPHPWDYSVTIVKIASYLLGRWINWFVYVWPWLIIHSDWHKHLINVSVLFRALSFYLLFAGLFSLLTLLDLIPFPYVLGWDFPYYVFSINITAFVFSAPKFQLIYL